MVNPKSVWLLPNSIIHTKKQAVVHFNHHILNKINRKLVHHLQDKSNLRLSLEEATRNYKVKHVPVKAYVHPGEDNITGEAALKSAQIIVNHKIIVNNRIMMLVTIVDCQRFMLVIQPKILTELQRIRYGRGV